MDTQELSYDFANFPIEVIENIFSYLAFDDVIQASSVCQRWFTASLCPGFVARVQLIINKDFSSEHPMYSILAKGSLRKFASVIFKSVIFNEDILEDQDVWINLGKTIIDLTFKWCTITESKLFSVLDHFNNLLELTISFDINKELDINSILPKYVDRLKTLCVRGSCPINYKAIAEISHKTPTIEKLVLDTIIYPSGYTMEPTVQLLEKLSMNLKSLSVYFYNDGIELLEVIPKMENLKLESLLCHMYNRIDKILFKSFAQKLCTLTDLDISPIRLKNSSFIEICTFMPNLKSLRLNECDTITNDGIIEVNRLKKLEKLTITQCQNVSNYGIINGIAKTRNETMKYILLAGYFSDDALIGIAQNMPNLRFFQICTSVFLSERCPRTIFEHLRWLRVLKLDSLNSESNKSSFEPLEVEQTLIPSLSEEFTISRIQGLRELSLNGFAQIFGASLKEIGKLKELKSLQISYFTDMSQLDYLSENCQSLKTIEINNCESISSEALYCLTTSLKRLKLLSLKQKEKIDEQCIKSIRATTKGLNVKYITN